MAILDKPVVLFSTPTIAAAAWRDFYVDVFRAPGGAAEVRMTVAAQIDVARKLGGKVVAVSVVLASGVGLPDSDARKALDAGMIAIAPHTKAAALALLATGFGGSIIRSMYIAAKYLNPTAYPMEITSTIPLACTFVGRYMDPLDADARIELAKVVALAEQAPPR